MNRIVFAVALPIIVLFSLIFYKQHIVNTGETVVLTIEGVDPRDLLSGHYLNYRIDFQAENQCNNQFINTQLCLRPYRRFAKEDQVDVDCQLYLSGSCRAGQFKAGIERYYIPEADAKELDKLVRESRGKLLVSINKEGKAVIKDLLIDGESWEKMNRHD